jgi:hypothetical protein
LAVNAGFCLSAPASVCAVAKTVPTGTTLTFDQPSNVTVAACASSCGTGDVAPKIIILDVPQSDQTSQVVHYLLWLTTLSPIPKSGATSAWVAQNGSAGASTPQVNAHRGRLADREEHQPRVSRDDDHGADRSRAAERLQHAAVGDCRGDAARRLLWVRLERSAWVQQ